MKQYIAELAGFLLLVLGGLYVVRADLAVRFQVWTQRVIMNAQYIPSERTYKVMRWLGAFLVLLGLLVITRAVWFAPQV